MPRPEGIDTTRADASPLRHGARDAVAVLVLAAVAMGCYHRQVLQPTGILVGPQEGGRTDLTSVFLAIRQYPLTVLRQERQMPTWNPYGLAGIPWFGSPQSALLYPANWVFLLTDGLWLAGWMMILHAALGGVGAYFLCRRYRFERAGAVLAGAAYLGAPYLVAHVAEGHYNQVCLMGWMPWAFLCFERLRSGRRAGVPLLSLVFALCFFCGHVQELYYLVLILTAWVAADCLAPARCRLPFSRPEWLGKWLLVGLCTAGLVAVELLPIFLYTRQAVRAAGMTAAEASAISLGWPSFLQLVDPYALGGPADYAGPGRFYWETLCHFGLAVSGLALVGMAVRRSDFRMRRLTLLLVVGILFALGDSTPVFSWLYRIVPGLSFFRAPSRALFFCSFAVAVLAGAGLDALCRRARRVLPAISVRTLSAVVILLAGFEASVHAHRVLRVIPPSFVRTGSPVVDLLKQRGDLFRVLAAQQLLSDREAWTNGIAKLHGYDPVPLSRAAVLFDALVPELEPADEIIGLESRSLSGYRQSVLDLMGVRYAVVDEATPRPKTGWKPVSRGSIPAEFTLAGRRRQNTRYVLLENLDVLPRAFVLGKTRPPLRRMALSEQLSVLDPRAELLMAKDRLPDGKRQEFRPANIQRYTPAEIVIDAELEAPGYLVLSDVYYPGWTAEVAGRSAPVVPANGILRAVPLPAGQHRVTLRFVPPGLALGMIASAATVMLLFYATFYGRTADREKRNGKKPNETN